MSLEIVSAEVEPDKEDSATEAGFTRSMSSSIDVLVIVFEAEVFVVANEPVEDVAPAESFVAEATSELLTRLFESCG